MSKSPLIASIDVGTNSFHIIIASVNARGIFTIHSRDKETVRLGEGSGDMKYLSPEAIERGVKTMERFAGMARNAKAVVRAVGTSAVREALNRDVFLQRVQESTGIEIEVISGNEEARLIYLGILQALPVYDSRVLFIDIGGGSTETGVGYQGDLRVMNSAKLGAIRMTRKFFEREKLTDKDIKQCRNYIKGEWALTFRSLLQEGYEQAVGSSGTTQTIFSIAYGLRNLPIPESFNGVTLDRETLLSVIDVILNARTTAARAALPGMEPRRADIITGGAIILEQAILGLNIRELTFSSCALREGILLDSYTKQQAIKKYHHLSNLRYESVLHLCEQCRVDMKHSTHVKDLALQLFDDLRPLHKYGDVERELLEAAAYLHDVGYHISADQHHKHSYYIIKNSAMLGFTTDEAELIANIARYHRKSHPKGKHENYQKIAVQKRLAVNTLAGILRIAEGLDRRQIQNVDSISARPEDGILRLTARYSGTASKPDIELWGAERKKTLLEASLDRKISFTIKHL